MAFLGDLRSARRQLTGRLGFSAVALLTLAVGIGACTAIFSVVNGVLLRPLPYPQPERLVVLHETNLPRFAQFGVAPGTLFTWQTAAGSFEGLAAMRGFPFNLTGLGEPVRVSGSQVGASAFSILGVAPALGRDFVTGEDVPGRNRVAIVSHGFWLRHLGGRAEAVSSTIQLDGQGFTVVGVMPKGFLGDRTEVFTPTAWPAIDHTNHVSHFISYVVGRLKPGVTLPQARSEMAVIADRLAQRFPAVKKGWGVKVTPMLEFEVGEVRPVLLSLLAAVGFLLLITCANVASLLLSRGIARSKEIAVRAALGATRGRIVRLLLTESVVLGLVGGLLGLVLAQWGTDLLLSLAPENLPRAGEIAVDGRALGFATALALITGVAFGLVPALTASRIRLHDALKDSPRGGSQGGRRTRLRGALVAGEVATALVLLVGAGLLVRSFARLQQVNPGFQPDGALAVSLELPQARYATDAQRVAFATAAAERLAALPDVQSVGGSQVGKFFSALPRHYFKIAGQPEVPVVEQPTTRGHSVTPDYFKAAGIPLLAGRLFDARDGARAPRVAIINESMARRFFPGQSPLGKRILLTKGADSSVWREIVGVVGDVRDFRLDADVETETYEPYAQAATGSLTFVVRAGGAATRPDLASAIQAAIHAVDADLPIASIRPLAEWVAESIARQRFAMFLFAVFSGVALLLAAMGIYGVMAYAVSQRTGEIGIRMALGARAGDVMRLVFAQGGRLVAVGLGAGLVGALLLTRFLASMLFGVTSHDPLTFAAIAALLALVAALACLFPARRATRVDPMTVLRGE